MLMKNLLKTGLVYLPAAALVTAADWLSKTWVAGNVPAGGGFIDVLPGFFRIVHVHNEGAAFSFLAGAGGWQKFLFAAIAVLISLYLAVLMYRASAARVWENTAFALIIGGALGNLYDRIVYSHVIDFLDFYVTWNGVPRHYPAFNVADCGVCAGVFIFAVYEIFFNGDKER